MGWIDSHCHIQGEYGSQWNDPLDVIEDAAGSDVTGIVCVGTDLDTSREGIELTLQLRNLLSRYSAQTSAVPDGVAEQVTNNLEAQRIGRLDQGVVHPGEQSKAEEERQAGAPARRRQTMTGSRHKVMATDCHAKFGEGQARDVYLLNLLSRFGIWCTAGIHPHDATTWKDDIGELEKLIATTLDNYPGMLVGIGECGLDYHYENSSKESQIAAFIAQIKLAKEYDLTLVIHAREAWDDIFAILATEGAPQRSIMHCFTGGPDELSTALSFGAYISFSGIITFSNAANTREAAKECPPERVLVETDSPFLSPTPNRGKPNRPAWVALVGDEIGALKGMSKATIQDITYSNTLRAFKITAPNERS